jgi:hypothetical protein
VSRVRLAPLRLVAVAVGYAAMQLVLGGPTGPAGRATIDPTASASPQAARKPHTNSPLVSDAGSDRSAVVASATRYLQLLDDPSPQAARSLAALTVSPLQPIALRAQAARASLEHNLATYTFVGGWRLGWRIDELTSGYARVAIWTVGLVAGPREVMAPYWSTTLCTLRRLGSHWRVSAARTVPGPTPPSAAAPASVAEAFARAAASFHRFDDAA